MLVSLLQNNNNGRIVAQPQPASGGYSNYALSDRLRDEEEGRIGHDLVPLLPDGTPAIPPPFLPEIDDRGRPRRRSPDRARHQHTPPRTDLESIVGDLRAEIQAVTERAAAAAQAAQRARVGWMIAGGGIAAFVTFLLMRDAKHGKRRRRR